MNKINKDKIKKDDAVIKDDKTLTDKDANGGKDAVKIETKSNSKVSENNNGKDSEKQKQTGSKGSNQGQKVKTKFRKESNNTKPNTKNSSNKDNGRLTMTGKGAGSSTIENKQDGSIPGSKEYVKPDTTTSAPGAPSSIEQTLEQTEIRKNASVGDGYADANAYVNKVIPGKAFGAENVNLHINKNTIMRMSEFINVVKAKKILSPMTTIVPYSVDEDTTMRSTFKKYTNSLLVNIQSDNNYGLRPEIITVGFLLNFSGYNPGIIRFLRDDISYDKGTFNSKKKKLGKIKLIEAEVKKDRYNLQLSKDPDKEVESARTATSGKAGFIGGYIPKEIDNPNGNLKYEFVDLPLTINGIDKKGIIPRDYLNDIGTIRMFKSFEVFISNALNITLNQPEFEEFRGLTRNVPELTHFTMVLINFNTFFRIVFYCIEKIKNRSLKISEKLGLVDSTFKHFYGSRITSEIQNIVDVIAGYVSQGPYNKRVFDLTTKMLEWGTINNDDVNNEFNSVVNPVAILAGDVEGDLPKREDFFIFREHAAASAIAIGKGDPLLLILNNLTDYFNYQQAYITSENYGLGNVPAFMDAIDGDNKEVKYRDYFTVSATRLTDSIYNLFTSLMRNSFVMDLLENYFQGSAQFLRFFKAKGLFDGTDFAMDTCPIPQLNTFGNDSISIFENMSLLRGLWLGTEYSQLQLLSDGELSDEKFLPSWNLFLETGKSKVNYSNLISFLLINRKWSEKDRFEITTYTASNFMKPEMIANNVDLVSVNVYDSTILPFVGTHQSIKCGWNDGTIMKGECYTFRSTIKQTTEADGLKEVNQDDKIQFLPVMFEYSKVVTESAIRFNKGMSTKLLTNHPKIGYYVSQSLVPFLLFAKDRAGKKFTLFYNNDLNFLPVNWWYNKDDQFSWIGIKDVPCWKTKVAQLFRLKVFGGLEPLARGRAFVEVPTLEECRLGNDN